MLTTFYYSGCDWAIRMIRQKSDLSISGEDESEEEKIDSSENTQVGFAGAQFGDISYEVVMNHYDISLKFEPLSPPSLARDTSEIESAISRYRRSLCYVRQESIPERLKVEIVFNCWYKGPSRDREAKERGLTKNQIDNIIYEFQTLKLVTKKFEEPLTKNVQSSQGGTRSGF